MGLCASWIQGVKQNSAQSLSEASIGLAVRLRLDLGFVKGNKNDGKYKSPYTLLLQVTKQK